MGQFKGIRGEDGTWETGTNLRTPACERKSYTSCVSLHSFPGMSIATVPLRLWEQ